MSFELPDFNIVTIQQPINERAEQRRQQAKKVAGIVTANDIQQAEIQKNIEKATRSVQKEQDYQRQKQQWDKQDALPIAQEIAGDIAPVYSTYKFTKNASRDFGRAGQLLSQGYVRPALGYGLKGVGNFGFGVASLFPFTGILKQAPNIVKLGIQTIGRNTTFKNKVAKKIAEKGAAKTAGDHSLFIADVYKGGNIRDPNFSFFTTDPEYAKNYGDVSKYKLEIKHPYVTETPLITTKDPVNNDMFIFDIVGKERFNDARMGIIGHDLHTGEFPKSKGLEILSLDRDNIIIPTKATPSTSLAFFERPQAKLTEAERLGIPRGERNQWLKGNTANVQWNSGLGLNNSNYMQKLTDYHFELSAPKTQTKGMYYNNSRFGQNFTIFDRNKIAGSNAEGFMFDPQTGQFVGTYNPPDRGFFFRPERLENLVDKTTARKYRLNVTNPATVAGRDQTVPLGKNGLIRFDALTDGIKKFGPVQEFEVQAMYPEQIKLYQWNAYDDAGNLIPLAQRHNFTNPDIRFKSGGKLNYLNYFK